MSDLFTTPLSDDMASLEHQAAASTDTFRQYQKTLQSLIRDELKQATSAIKDNVSALNQQATALERTQTSIAKIGDQYGALRDRATDDIYAVTRSLDTLSDHQDSVLTGLSNKFTDSLAERLNTIKTSLATLQNKAPGSLSGAEYQKLVGLQTEQTSLQNYVSSQSPAFQTTFASQSALAASSPTQQLIANYQTQTAAQNQIFASQKDALVEKQNLDKAFADGAKVWVQAEGDRLHAFVQTSTGVKEILSDDNIAYAQSLVNRKAQLQDELLTQISTLNGIKQATTGTLGLLGQQWDAYYSDLDARTNASVANIIAKLSSLKGGPTPVSTTSSKSVNVSIGSVSSQTVVNTSDLVQQLKRGLWGLL